MDEDIKTAIDAPRPHHQLLPMKIKQEMFIKKVNPKKTKEIFYMFCVLIIFSKNLISGYS